MHFSDGKPLKQVDKATYLGGEINKDAGRWSELDNRINIALRTCNKLKTFLVPNGLLLQMKVAGI